MNAVMSRLVLAPMLLVGCLWNLTLGVPQVRASEAQPQDSVDDVPSGLRDAVSEALESEDRALAGVGEQISPATHQAANHILAAALFDTEVKISASDAAAGDGFGVSVSVSGDTAIVGARFDADGGFHSGSAYIFQRGLGGANNWGQVKKLTASDAASDDWFGHSVSISGGTAIVGAFFDDDAGSNSNSGSAYVFERDQGGANNWGEVMKLTASDETAGDEFGYSVSISGDTAIIGAIFDDDGGSLSGSAYVFMRNQGGVNNWGQVTKVTASDAAADDRFGSTVCIDGDMAIVGAYQDDDGGSDSGSAYILQRDQGGANNWGQVKKITAFDAAAVDQFGWNVSINGDTAIVGSWKDDDAGSASGSAYIFQRDQGGGNNWGHVMKLTASDAANGDGFGVSVSASVDTVIVGAVNDDDAGSNSGSTYVYQRNHGGANNWGQVNKLTASDAEAGDFFGGKVSLSGGTAIFGAGGDDDTGASSGSAYIYYKAPVCGDGIVSTSEGCDDGGIVDDDGCSSTCVIESGFGCVGEPSYCGVDCNENGTPDECDLDCGTTGGPCDVAGCGLGSDADADGVPDECDNCPGYNDAEPCPIPAVSEWGLIAMTLLTLVGGTVLINRRRAIV